jgi:FkbM family methyltransferase
MTFVSYAQNFEDVLLWRVFKDQGPGFYIDVGAGHPDTDSVTRAFYDRGWRGVNIEPVPEFFLRIEAARPRDVNRRVAVGEAPGQADFFVVPGTGLSTLDAAVAEKCRAAHFDVQAQSVEVTTLAEICRQHVQGDIHFLKIDVEGAERSVLAGADLGRYRPWVVVVEATAPMSTLPSHDSWEPGLLAAGYRFLWFDGLNRFYAAEERHGDVAVHFQTPVNVFDDAIRAGDCEQARRIATAESQAADLLERALTAEASLAANAEARFEARLAGIEGRLSHADAQAAAAGTRAYMAESRLTSELQARLRSQAADIAEKTRLEAALAQEKSLLQGALGEMAQLRAQARAASDLAASYLTSTSWRLTAPVRGASLLARGVLRRVRFRRAAWAQGAAPAIRSIPNAVAHAPAAATPMSLAAEPPRPVAAAALRRSVHQFHSGSAVGDAITNSLLLVQRQLRAMGYRSEIYVEHRDDRLAAELRTLDDLPAHDDYVLIVHHSMGFDAFDRVAALPVRKILMYHNITPAALFADLPVLQDYARLGRTQLERWRTLVTAALADSAFNAIELQKLGFDPIAVCTMLFDIAALRARAAVATRSDPSMFTLLFVGRVIASKGQSDLVAAYAAFRRQYEGANRLVIVGSYDGAGAAYFDMLQSQVASLGLGAHVVLTGRVSDDELYDWYAQADLYVSLSHHEGFGVPLVEAMALGVPVLAWPAGAVPFTIAGAGEVLLDRAPGAAADQMLALARDPERRAQMARHGRQAIDRFALSAQAPALLRALTLAGTAPPADPAAAALLADHVRFTVTGHLAGSYSLAAINRGLLRTLESAFPARVRALAVAAEQPTLAERLPAEDRAEILQLAGRLPHETGPDIVISQHYPVLVPEHRGDVLLAMFFWEESLIPQATIDGLNASFKAVLAPSSFVAKALIDSGLSIPVARVGFAPELSRFAAMVRTPAAHRQPFVFLHVSSCFPRKGIPALLAAYVGAFRRGDPVRLVIKGFANPHNDTAAQVAAIRLADPDAPAIEVVERDMAQTELLALYEAADAMVLPTHGEGFNLPAAEALACGLPLIVTGHGGHMDFCDASNARLVAYRFAPSGSHLATAGSVWVEPDVADLAAAMTEAVAGRADIGARAEAGRANIGQLFAPAAFAQRVAEAAVARLVMPPDRPMHLAVISSWGVRCGVAEYSRFLVEAMRLADPSLRITIVADKRSPAAAGGEADLAVAPSWQAGARDPQDALRRAIAGADPDAIIVQHQPGLIPWGTLGVLLHDLVDACRPLIVTLHNTRHLLDVDEAERCCALDGLGLAARVIVHTVADLNRLKTLGLTGNVTLLPQGAPEPAGVRATRALTGTQAALIGCCGFFLPGKGVGQLIEAMGHLKARWPKARLRLVNADYGSEDSIAEIAACRDAATALGVAESIEWNTAFLPIDELREKLGECDAVVLPYQDTKEASSAALRTALAAGVCVAVTPIPIFDEAAQAVFRLPGTTPHLIADGLNDLLADQALRTRTQAGAASWLEDRAWSRIGRQMVGMLRGLAR